MSSERAELLFTLEEILDLMPQFRLGQLVSNLALFSDQKQPSVYEVDDDDLLKEATRFLGVQRVRLAEPALRAVPPYEVDAAALRETRQSIYSELERLLERFPDMRLGQLISNLSTIAVGLPDCVYDVEDEALLQEARNMVKRLNERRDVRAALSVVAKAS